jgi:hypothetical protein
MKQFLLIFQLLLVATWLSAQTADTTFQTVSQENGPLEKQRLQNRYDQVFGTQENTPWLFTLGYTGLSDNGSDRIRAGVELKLLPAFSLHGSYGLGYSYSPSSPFNRSTSIFTHRFAVEPRWYYNMARRIREGKSANNVSGNYIGLEAVLQTTKFEIGTMPVTLSQKSFALRYGIQRRLFRYGFIDLGVGVGALKEDRTAFQDPYNDKWHLFANSHIGIGLALAKPSKERESPEYCDVLHCFEEERRMWKIDLYNLIRLNDFDNIRAQLSVGYEQKIGNSPFSVEVQGQFTRQRNHYTTRLSNPVEITYNRYIVGAALQPRYYYAQKRRIAKGKSGNNLSGVYLGAQLQWKEEQERFNGYVCGVNGCFPEDSKFRKQTTSSGFVWGIQHRLFQHGFVDLTVGVLMDRTRRTETLSPQTPSTTRTYTEPNYFLNLRAGIAF